VHHRSAVRAELPGVKPHLRTARRIPLACSSRRSAVSPPGFTLVELLTVMLVMALLGMLALPSLSGFSAGASVSGSHSALRASIELARSEAITRALRVAVCRSGNANEAAANCSDAAQAGFAARDWAVGWIVYAKGAGNSADVFEAGDLLLQRTPTRQSRQQAARATLWAPADGAIVFDWNGLRTSGLTGTFLIDWGAQVAARPANARFDRAICLHVNVAGRVDSRSPVNGACP
jgi:prepilin-type N-terminal cleavage/methylation domain-containing protein